MEGCAGVGVRDDGAGVELNGTRGKRGNFGFAVKAHDDGAAGAIDFAECFGEPGNAEGIEAGGGFVEQQNAGAMDERAGDGDALAHAAGKSANERGAAFVQADFAEQFFGAGGGLGNILEFGEEDKIFFGGKFVVDHGGVGDVAGAIVGGRGGIGAGERESARGGTNDAGGYAEKRGFSGAVASGEDDTFAGRNLQGDAAEGEKAAITLIDVFEAQAGWGERRQSVFPRCARWCWAGIPLGSAYG